MDEDNFLELLDLYMDMVEKQDEIIYRLGKIVARMTRRLQIKSWKRIWQSSGRLWSSIKKPVLN